jgi:transcription initiation factor TFIID subunit 2
MQRVPHVFTTPSSPDAARCWVPCLDNPWDKCTWEFEFVVAKRLEEGDQDRARRRASGTLDGDAQFQEDEHPTIVVCSGDLVEQVSILLPWDRS